MNQEMSSISGTTHWTKVTERPLFELSSLLANVAYRQATAVYLRRALGALKLVRGIENDCLVYPTSI